MYFSQLAVQNYISIAFLALVMGIVGMPLWMKLAKDDGLRNIAASKTPAEVFGQESEPQ
jgi:hypothetical protein